MSRTCIICGKDEGFTHKYEGRVALEIHKHTWDDNIKNILKNG
jgi:hypothetical protein